MLQLDHLAVSGASLAAAQAHVETVLHTHMQPGGEHDIFHTHNTLLGLKDDLYLEAIATNPDAPTPERPRWFDLDRFDGAPRLTNWICRTDDIEAAAARFSEAGVPVALRRGDMKWRMAVPASGILPFDNLFPALIQWDVPVRPPERLDARDIRLKTLTIHHPWVDALKSMLAPVLSDPRVDFESGPAQLSAEFETPSGLCKL